MGKSADGRRKLLLCGLWGLAAVCGLTILIVLLGPLADLLGSQDVQGVPRAMRGVQLALAIDAARGRILQLGGGLLILGTLIFTARSFTLARRQSELNR